MTTWGNTRAQRLRQWVLFRLFGWESPSVGAVTLGEAWTGEVVRDQFARGIADGMARAAAPAPVICEVCGKPIEDGQTCGFVVVRDLTYGRIGDPSPFPTGVTRGRRSYHHARCADKRVSPPKPTT